MANKNSDLATLKNIGPASERWLNDIGIYTREELLALGAVPAYRCLKAAGYNVSLNLVYAIQGAIMDVHWTDLPLALREELKQQIAESEANLR